MLDTIRWATLLIWAVWLVLYWGAGVGLVANLRRAFHSSAFFYDRFFILGLVILSNIILWSGYALLRGHLRDPLPRSLWLLVVVGGFLTLSGATGTFWCRQQMRASWSAHTLPVPNQPLVENGPYRVVRHPIYAFACLKTFGTMLVFPMWWNALAGLAMIILYVLKLQYEESILIERLPGYEEYRQRVRYRLVPYVW